MKAGKQPDGDMGWVIGMGMPERPQPPQPPAQRPNTVTQGHLAVKLAEFAKAMQAALRGERRSLLNKLEQRDLHITLLEQRVEALEERLRDCSAVGPAPPATKAIP